MKIYRTYASFLLFSLLLIHSLTFANTSYTVNQITSLEVDSSINPAVYNYLENNLNKLSAEKGDLVLIKLDTPGGLVTTTKDILTLFGTKSFPIVIWITPEGASATSAGAIIASGAHVLAMSEGTNIGAATPIGMGGDIQQDDARSKAINDLVALVKALSVSRGRNAEEFGKMISEAKSLDAREAEKLKVIDGIINNQKDLLKLLSQKKIVVLGKKITLDVSQNTPITAVEMDPGQKILNIFADPSTAYVLFIIGAALIYFELQAPGGVIAGGLGALCLILAAIGFQVLPLNFGAVGLIVLAFALFVLEAFVASFGLLTLGGIAALVFGSLFLFRTEDSFIQLEQSIIFSVVGAVSLYVIFIGWYMVKTHIRKKNYYSQQNEHGTVSQVLAGEKYQVKVNGEIWNAHSSEVLQVGDKVDIINEDSDNLILKIQKSKSY
ncbi:MAG: hypothetical protein CME62_15365 [Halobacteriovoraceae bacterium]|nr:hypothetical protein [Halobacteriovoraceae bacterium]|tara:strand:+ start:20644 stop:21957 length:1314 start_codon:yes stop_codon:yes gene_type:complete